MSHHDRESDHRESDRRDSDRRDSDRRDSDHRESDHRESDRRDSDRRDSDQDAALIEPLSEASGLCGGPGQLSCGEANELIQFYIDEVADADAGVRVAEHLHDCPPCESEAVVYQRIVAALSRCRPNVPVDVEQRIKRFCTELSAGAHDGDLLVDE